MSNLIGRNPEQVPVNGMLGGLAFQDPEAVSIKNGVVNAQLRRNAPVTKTVSFTLADTEHWITCNGAASITVTLPSAALNVGREVMLRNIAAFTVVSASSNVVPIATATPGTAILAATAGKCATLVSDGTDWVVMAAN